ncbi:unnamed protein product [Albugo candida]|uniref:Uncharacterized protein n=1 Tax=Albugo candida TaxID=65357 RepID=A0A024GQX6_9STRA|nr:unnamed protein product [Albugo candida]|eukprot:CCI49197.1 unnamed protein product [Albugo candida]
MERIDCNSTETLVARYAASRIAAIIGLHAYADIVQDFCEDRVELMERDASELKLEILSRDEELEQIVRLTGKKGKRTLEEILSWTREPLQGENAVTLGNARMLLEDSRNALTHARKRNKISTEQCAQAESIMRSRIRQSIGVRNEQLAIKAYETNTGNQVREMNDVYHYLIFPNVANVMNAFDVEKHLRRLCIPKTLTSGNDRQREQMERSGYFSICGMVDGVCDALKIVNATSEDEEWELVRILVEVKNRVHAFADPPPLHDCIQMAIYFKMLDVQEGDLVQFMNEDEMVIHTTRVSWDLYPLKCRMYGDESKEMTTFV